MVTTGYLGAGSDMDAPYVEPRPVAAKRELFSVDLNERPANLSELPAELIKDSTRM